MKRRSREDDDASRICEVGSEWMTRRWTPRVDDDDDEKGISELGSQWMSSRPSLRKTNGCRSASETRRRFHGVNSDQAQPWASRTDQPRPSLKTRAWKDGEREHGEWISEMGSAAWANRSTHHSNGNGSFAESIAELGSELLQKKRTCVEDELTDDSWVADVGYRWVNRQRNSKNHNLSQSQVWRTSELQKSDWVCALGFQWMARRKEGGEEALNGRTLLSDPSSLLHMSRKRSQDDDWISHVGAAWMSGKKTTRDQCVAVLDRQWYDTRRKLQFTAPGRGYTGFETGESGQVNGLGTQELGHINGLEFFHAPERSGSEQLGGEEADVEGLGSSFGELKTPAMFSPFDSGSNSYY